MPARCASPTPARRSRRSTRPRSGAPPRASCRSCARPTSWPSSVRSRAWRRRRPRRRRLTHAGTSCDSSTPAHQEAAWLQGPAGRGPPHRRAGAHRQAEEPGADHRLAAVRGACLDGAVLRAGGVPRRPSHRALARAGHASVAQEPRGGARPADRGDHRDARAGPGLLRPQRRRRCGARRGAGRHAYSRPVHPPAMAARGGVRLRAGRARHAGDLACRSRRARPAGRLDDRDLERHACAASGQRQRLPAGHRGAAQPAARRRSRPIRRKRAAAAARATPCRSTTCRRIASCITSCSARRCAPRRCAGWARCPTSMRSNR